MKFVIFLAFMAFKVIMAIDPDRAPTCEPLKSDMCRSNNAMLYNMTGMPNLANQKTQADANYELATYFPLIKTGCAPELQFFLCSVYVPMCITHSPQKIIGPCRPLCEQVKRKCEATLKNTFQLSWPDVLECSKFPMTNVHKHMCIEVPGDGQFSLLGLPPSSLNTLQTNPLFMEKVKEQLAGGITLDKLKPYRNYMELLENNFDKLEPAKGVNIQCGHLKKSFKYVYNKKKETCVPKCEAEISFSMENKTNTASLVMALSAFCFALSLFTLMVYILNSCCWSDLSGGQKTTTAFAESSPAFLSLAFVGYSFGYLISQIGLQHDSKWLCVSNSEEEHSGNNHPELLVASEGQRSQPCIVIFLFVYYFGSAAAAWWPVVAFSWSLAQYFQLPKNTMATVTMFGHLYGWGIPAIFTLAAIVQHLIEADELTSICLPGALQDDQSFLVYIVIPEGVHLILGAVFYLSGICLAFFCGNASTNERVRGKSEAKQLRSLRWRFSCYGIIYILAKVCVFATLVYEYANRRAWLVVSTKDLPDVNLFWVRITLSFLVGILLPWWVLTRQNFLRCQQSLTCVFWKTKKDVLHPQVAYRPQAMSDNQIISINHQQPGLGPRRQDYL